MSGRPRRLLLRAVGSVAHALLAAGLVPGDTALLVYMPGLEFIVGLLGCLRSGIIAVPSYPPDPSKALAPQLAAMGAIAEAAGGWLHFAFILNAAAASCCVKNKVVFVCPLRILKKGCTRNFFKAYYA